MQVTPRGIAIYKIRPEPEADPEIGILWADEDVGALEALRNWLGDPNPPVSVT